MEKGKVPWADGYTQKDLGWGCDGEGCGGWTRRCTLLAGRRKPLGRRFFLSVSPELEVPCSQSLNGMTMYVLVQKRTRSCGRGEQCVQRRGGGEREWGVTSQGAARALMKRAASARRQGWAYPVATMSHPPAGLTQSWYRVHEHVDTCRGGWRE